MTEENLPFLVIGKGPRDLGQIASLFADAWRSLTFVERWKPTDVVFRSEEFAGLIILGDDRAWATSRKYKRDREWLLTALTNARPVLGICYGAQLLAAHLAGATNGPLAKQPNMDHAGRVVDVEMRGHGLTDPVMEPLRRCPLATMSHEDSFQEPPGATALAWSTGQAAEHCEAFRVGPPEDAVYGLQFHPEPTREMLEEDGWFDKMPDARSLRAVVATGRLVLERWLRLAIGRS